MPAAEFTVGPFTFQHDAELHEMYVVKGEETAAMVECVDVDAWAAFAKAAMRGWPSVHTGQSA